MATPLAFVQSLGTFSVSIAANTLPITLTAAPTTAGDALVLWCAWGSTTVALSGTPATDTAGNTWTAVSTITGTADRAALLVCLAPKRLRSGDKVTVSFSGNTVSVGSLAEFAGLKATGTNTDGTNSATGAGASGTSQAVASGAVATTNANDVLLGLAASNQNAGGDAFTAAGWTVLTAVATTSLKLWPAYQIVSATGSYNLSGSITGGGTLTRATIAAEWTYKQSDVDAPDVSGLAAEVEVVGQTRVVSGVAVEVEYVGTRAAVSNVAVEVEYVPSLGIVPWAPVVG